MARPSVPDNRRAAFSLYEIAGRLGTTVTTVSRWVDQGLIRSVRIGGRVFIPATELSRLLEEKSQEAAAV